jgi:ribonuclease HI
MQKRLITNVDGTLNKAIVYADGGVGEHQGKTITTEGVAVFNHEQILIAVHPYHDPVHTTNQQSELTAAILGIRHAVNHGYRLIDIHTDSAYTVNCFKDRWWNGWANKGWKNYAKKPISNADLWQVLLWGDLGYRTMVAENNLPRLEYDKAVTLFGIAPEEIIVNFTKVKGHSGLPGNELADALATVAKVPPSDGLTKLTPINESKYHSLVGRNINTLLDGRGNFIF